MRDNKIILELADDLSVIVTATVPSKDPANPEPVTRVITIARGDVTGHDKLIANLNELLFDIGR